MADKEHVVYKSNYSLHHSDKTFDGGSCLIRHLSSYTEENSCSYRWQALDKARNTPEVKEIYDYHSNKEYHIDGKDWRAVDPRLLDSLGIADNPNKTDYERKKDKAKRTNIEVNNFTKGSLPYETQVHHVLNNSSLKKGINEVALIYWPIRNVICKGLLTEKYNLNHKDNNLIMPCKDIDAKATGLPMHNGGHQKYSDKILSAVKETLKPYKKIAKQMKKDKKKHDAPDPEELKEALEEISNIMYGNLISLAKENRMTKTVITINDVPGKTFNGI